MKTTYNEPNFKLLMLIQEMFGGMDTNPLPKPIPSKKADKKQKK